jgi:hypothetical protein
MRGVSALLLLLLLVVSLTDRKRGDFALGLRDAGRCWLGGVGVSRCVDKLELACLDGAPLDSVAAP